MCYKKHLAALDLVSTQGWGSTKAPKQVQRGESVEFSSLSPVISVAPFHQNTLISRALAPTRRPRRPNKVLSDFDVWDLQINPRWVSWGLGSGINRNIS